MAKKLTVKNYIRLNGEDVDMDTLPEDVRRDICRQIQITFMRTAGYREVKKDNTEVTA